MSHSLSLLSLMLLASNMGRTLSTQPLLLTPYLERGEIDQARELCKVSQSELLHGYAGFKDINMESYAGFITVDSDVRNHLFFWFFPSTTEENAPLMIWLNGGPTISSMLGVFWENGPIEVERLENSSSFSFTPRTHTWVGPFSMLYIDNPVGTGFSFTETGDNGTRLYQSGYTEDLFSFVKQFLVLFPEYHQRELYIGGQSYAGKYVPALAHRIHRHIQEGNSDIPLTGIYLGGPYFDPETEAPAFFDFTYSMGFISHATWVESKRKVKELFEEFNEGELRNINASYLMPILFTYLGLNTKDNFVTLVPANYAMVDTVMMSSRVRKAVHAGDADYWIMNDELYNKLVPSDILVSTKPQMTQLMNHYKVLIFNGDYDVIVNSAMVEAAIMSTPWSLQTQYNSSTERIVWRTASGQFRGYYSRAGQLCRVIVHGAGHQTPHDKAKSTLDMMKEFVTSGCVTDHIV